MSRFAIVLRFDELDEAARQTLWERVRPVLLPSLSLEPQSHAQASSPRRLLLQFLRKVAPRLDLGAFDLARLASHPLNGREIKHALQSAQALALIDEQVLSMEHIDEVLSIRRT